MCVIYYSSSQSLQLLRKCMNSYLFHASFIGFVNDISYICIGFQIKQYKIYVREHRL